MAEDDLREEARTRIQKRRDLGRRVVVYVVVNAILIGIWATSGAGYFWPAWVMLALGVGLVFNAWDVFVRRPVTEADIEREMKRTQE